MQQDYYFKGARWVGAQERTATDFAILRGHFQLTGNETVTLSVLGLGFFHCYINGHCLNPDTFLPLSSDYEAGCDPVQEQLSGHRIYVPQFDATPYVKAGDNVIAIHYGGGWYTSKVRVFGLPKAIYCITATEGESIRTFLSDDSCRIGSGGILDYCFTTHETQQCGADACQPAFDDADWAYATVTEQLLTEYVETNCPWDRVIAELTPRRVGEGEDGIVYDAGKNLSGYPVLRLHAAAGERVTVRFSEDLLPDGRLDMTHSHEQRYTVIADGQERCVQPQFTWFGFRYLEVKGAAEPLTVKLVHADVPVNSSFHCDNETVNWIYETFLHTMLCNMHTGHPSDCPHIERRGYTGDGQLTCHAVLSALDARAFYEKWLQDIADCQDTLSGHIQYTAPYVRSGGGPGGWGSAIVEVPYQLYRHYGDTAVLSRYYSSMRRYLDYMESHSDCGLVTRDKEGEWCLGDWCGPVILYPDKDITFADQQVLLPAAMVNTYFLVKTLEKLCQIARVIGRDEDVPDYEARMAARKRALQAAYYNEFDGNFIMNVQGANAYAVDLGLGGDRTYGNLLDYYRKLGHYDTGIFATDILTRILFERGDGELAVALLTQDGAQGYEHWRRNGATTLHEYWDSNRSRSHSHPMFGAPVAYLFEYLLGIRQREGTVGYTSLIIAPQAVSQFHHMDGSLQGTRGRIAVRYDREGDRIRFQIELPEGTEAVLRYGRQEHPLTIGHNEWETTL